MKKNGKQAPAKVTQRNTTVLRRQAPAAKRTRLILGRYIVADSAICHGKPTFRGTRIMVWQVLEMVSEGMAWQSIVEQCHNSISKDAITEAVKLSSEAFLKHAGEFVVEQAVV